MPQIFLSHSYGKSTDFAKIFYNWLTDSPIGMKPWASFDPTDLPQGGNDHGRIIHAAKKSDLCVCILTKDNLMHQWVNFEAGLFYGKRSDISCVYTILIDGLSHTDLTGGITRSHPLGTIYHCSLTKKTASLEDFLITIYKNHSAEEGPINSLHPRVSESIHKFVKNSSKKLISEAIRLGISV